MSGSARINTPGADPGKGLDREGWDHCDAEERDGARNDQQHEGVEDDHGYQHPTTGLFQASFDRGTGSRPHLIANQASPNTVEYQSTSTPTSRSMASPAHASAHRSSRPPYRSVPSSTARYSYQTTSTGMTSPTPSGTSFWGGGGAGAGRAGGGIGQAAQGGWKRYGWQGSGDEESTVETELTVPSDSPKKDEVGTETVQQTSQCHIQDRPPTTQANLPSTTQASIHPRQLSQVREDPIAESAQPSRQVSASHTALALARDGDPGQPTASPLKHTRSRKRSYQLSKKLGPAALGPSTRMGTPSPPRVETSGASASAAGLRAAFESPNRAIVNSLAKGVPSPSLAALAESKIVMSRVNRLQTGGADSGSSGNSARTVSTGNGKRQPSGSSGLRLSGSPPDTSLSKSHTSSRIRPPAFPLESPPVRPASPTLDRTGSARRMIDVFESLPHTPTGYTINSDGSPTPARGSAARSALQAISTREYRVANSASRERERERASPAYSSSYLRQKALPPDPSTPAPSGLGNSLRPPPGSESAAPTLLSAYSPHNKMPIRDDFPLSSSMVIPTSPGRSKHLASPTSGKSIHSRSPLSKSPLKEIISAFSSMGKKVAGRRRRGISLGQSDADDSSIDWYAGLKPVTEAKHDSARSRSLPRDKMGDKEMSDAYSGLASTVDLGDITRQGQLMYLQPAPCASLTEWGEWTRFHATLHPATLRLAAHDAISQPILLDISKCSDLRTLRSGEIHSRGIPNPGSDLAYENTNVHVIELVFQDDSRQYIGVEGVGERLGWTTALWDALVVARGEPQHSVVQRGATPEVPYAEPPYSPPKMMSAVMESAAPRTIKERMAVFEPESLDYADELPKVALTAPLQIRNRVSMLSLQSGHAGSAVDFPKVDHGKPIEPPGDAGQQKAPDSTQIPHSYGEPEHLPAERQLSIFSDGTATEQKSANAFGFPPEDAHLEGDEAELSFDDSDLNPSRSASQRVPRRRDTQQSRASTVMPARTRATATADHVQPGQIMRFPEPVPTPELVEPPTEQDPTASEQPVGRRTLPAPPTAAPSGAAFLTSNDLAILLTKLDKLPEAVGVHLKDSLQHAVGAIAEPTTVAQTKELAIAQPTNPEALADLNVKLDAILGALEGLKEGVATKAAGSLDRSATPPIATTKAVSADEAAAGKEISEIMTAAGVQAPGRSEPPAAETAVDEGPPAASPGTQRLEELLSGVQAIQAGREQQEQKTADMARYMAQLNAWLEKFVTNGTTEIQAMSGEVSRLVEQIAPAQPPSDRGQPAPPPPRSLPAMMQEMQTVLSSIQARQAEETMTGARLDGLVATLAQDRQRQEQGHAAVEKVMAALDRQRGEHETLLRALATDLTSEIRGERLRFVEAMKEATNINVHMHVEEFKKNLSQEIAQHSQELAAMREQKRSLEAVISDLLSIKAKYAAEPSALSAAQQGAKSPSLAPPSPGPPARSHTPRPLPVPH